MLIRFKRSLQIFLKVLSCLNTVFAFVVLMLQSIPFPILFGAVALIIGVVFFLVIRSNQKLKKEGTKVMATVVGFREEIDRNDRTSRLYYPIVRFATLEGAEMETSLTVGRGRPQFQVGTVVQIAYDPKNPRRAALL